MRRGLWSGGSSSSYNSTLDPARVELAQQAFTGFVDDHFDGRRSEMADRGERAGRGWADGGRGFPGVEV